LFDRQENELLSQYVLQQELVLSPVDEMIAHDAMRDAFYESAKHGLNQMLMQGITKDDTKSRSGVATPLMLERANNFAAQYAKKNSGDLITGVTERTQERVNGLVQDAVKQGWSVDKLAGELAKRGHFSEARAETIARTEISAAQNAGMVRAGKEYQRNHPEETVEKVWLTTGANPCMICLEHDGETVPVGHGFSDGLTVPAHPRCMCEIQIVIGMHDVDYTDEDEDE
jgi:hypothetical protein